MATKATAATPDPGARANVLKLWVLATTRANIFDGHPCSYFSDRSCLVGDLAGFNTDAFYKTALKILQRACTLTVDPVTGASVNGPFEGVRIAFQNDILGTGWDPQDHTHPGGTEFNVTINP